MKRKIIKPTKDKTFDFIIRILLTGSVEVSYLFAFTLIFLHHFYSLSILSLKSIVWALTILISNIIKK